VKGSDLYLNFYERGDQARLEKLIQNDLTVNRILSYDAADEILDLYQQRHLFTYDLQYNASRVSKGREVFIFGDTLDVPYSSSLE
jgi:DNA adenine methylase